MGLRHNDTHHCCAAGGRTCVCIGHKKKRNRFLEQIHGWKHLYLCISFTTFRNSAITPATPSIQKRTTRRYSLDALTAVWQSDISFRALQGPGHCRSSLKMWFQYLIFPVLYLLSVSNNFTAVLAGTSTSRGTCLLISRSCSKKQAYGTTR